MKNKLNKVFFMAIMLIGSSIFAQQTVRGTVSDGDGLLPGANVVVKGTANGTTSDFDGNYVLENVPSDGVLIFSFIGYTTSEISVNGQSVLDVTLIEDANALDEVVVTGYTSQTRGDITGAVSSVDMGEALKVPVSNAAEVLQGRVTGVTVVSAGEPGAAPKITIRGIGTANDSDPLYIIDGVQTTDPNILNSINPADIDQMNVLKDAAAAIYGARASNGVIIITTKSGGYNMASATVTLDAYTGISKAYNLPDNLNTSQHMAMIRQSLVNDGAEIIHQQYDPNGTGTFTIPNQLLGVPVDATVKQPNGTNWNDAVTRSAPINNISFSAQNGTESGKYYFSANYFNQDGIMEYTGFERASAMVNTEFKIRDVVRIGEHMNVAYTDGNGGNSSAIEMASRMTPLVPVYDDDGNFAGTYSNSSGLSNTLNPVAQLYRDKDNFNKSLRVFGDIYIEADLYEGLTFRTSYGVSMHHLDQRFFSPLTPEHSEPVSTNTLNVQDQSSYEWTWSNTLNYQRIFGLHNINAVLGIEAVEGGGIGKGITRTGYLFEDPDFYNLSNGSGTPNVSYAYEYKNSLFSYFFSANYSYDGKWFATVTVRNDTSSRFAGDNKSDTFPSFSVGWLLSKSDWYNSEVVNRIKLKASYGQLGNQTLPGSNPTINISVLSEQFANYALNGGSASTGAILESIGNPNLKWETSITTNIGIDLGFLNNKIYLTADFYQINTEDLISQDFSLISTTAIDAAAPYVNLGSVKNTGVDLTIGYNNTWDSGWTFGVVGNFSHYKNEVTDLISEFQPGNDGFRGGAVTRTETGRAISEFYGRVVTGLDDTGRFVYKDVNGDGIINDDDRDYIGSPHPDFTWGVNFTTSYRGFDASLFFSGSQGNDIYNYEKIYSDFPTFFNGNRSTRVINSWTPDNTNTNMPALSQTITNAETNPNSFFVEDGSFARLKNLQIGYTFAEDQFNFGNVMQSIRVYVSGTNMFTITGYDGIDPEVISYDNLTLGVDNQIYPISQIYSLGVTLKF